MKRKSNEEFLNQLKLKMEDDFNNYTFLTEYSGNKNKIKIRHNLCNREFEITANDFINRHRCPLCSREKMLNNLQKIGKSNKKDFKIFENEFKKLSNNGEYKLLSKYEGKDKKIKIYHSICNKIYETTPAVYLQGCKCPHCQKENQKINSEKHRKTHDAFLNECISKRNDMDEYELLTNYVNKRTKIKVKHKKCGREYFVSPWHFVNGSKCKACCFNNGSIYTNKIKEYLILFGYKENIGFKREYSFEDCKNTFSLKFDFAIFNNDGSIKALIEYDGPQHYSPIYPLKGEQKEKDKKLRQQQHNDRIKDDYCRNKNIPLLRITYKENKSIKEKVYKFLNSTTISKESTLK